MVAEGRHFIMNKIWVLTFSNLRKNKGVSATLFFILFTAVILLNLGILTFLNFGKSFDRMSEDTNSAHIMALMYQQYYEESYEEYFNNYPQVTETEKEEVIYLWTTIFRYGKGELVSPCIFQNADEDRNLSKLSFAGEQKPSGTHDIYVSYIMHTGGGYNLGDDFIVKYKGGQYTFRIAGFTQDIHLGSITLGCIGFYLPEETFHWFSEELGAGRTEGILLKARLQNSAVSEDMAADFNRDQISVSQTGQAASIWLSSYTLAKHTRSATANIVGAVITCFSLIIVTVSLLIMRYRVNTGIQEGLTDIGILKALGFTNRQISVSILAQYGCIALSAAILGIAASYAFSGTLSYMFSAQTGILWKQGFDPKATLISLTILFIFVSVMIPMSAARVKKLHPVSALRAGTNTQDLKKNYCPIARMKGKLNFILAFKTMVTNLRQNVRISVIIAAISFTSVFAVIIYYNIAADNKAFLDMIGSETSSVMVSMAQSGDAVSLREEILAMEEVEKAINYDYMTVTINNETSQVMIVNDYDALDTNPVYTGRYPQNSNEVVISSYMADRFGKKVGDQIEVRMGEASAGYKIVGLIQSISNIGMNLSMTLEGIRCLLPYYSFHNVNVYLKDGVSAERFISMLKKNYGDQIKEIINMQDLSDSQLGVYVLIVSIFAVMILLVTALIVSMTLYLIIKALINRRQREFGIQKAIGYTTPQLMLQVSLSFLPVVFVGVCSGSILGSFYINPLVSIVFKGIGIMKAGFTIPVLWIVLLCAGICMLAFFVSMLVCARIRKITAYVLIGE